DKEFDVYSAEKCENLEINLSPQQTDAFTELVKMLQTNKPHACLLHGVTSSGKTLVFVKLLEEVLKKGKRAIVLVPEIGLTPQMVKRLKNAFGKKVAVVHSALGNTERLLQWQQIQHCEADIVVGTRSAVFAPVENLGLIIIDEEQEHTYRSEQAPRFLAHDVAKMRVTENNALLLLASATPSVESYYYANTGKYSLLEMSERYGNLPLPEVEIVDMRENLLLGNVGFLSARLREEICNNLNNDEQTILLLNRRGYQTVAICKNCAEVIKCENCSVPMVYHKAQNKLLCHHCGATTSPAPNICPKCGGEMKYTGYGTQKVEEELQGEFPNARILRMDLDSTTKKNAHEEMLSAFAKGEYDILIGTQMVAKGLDFEKVSLVGVVGVDSLHFSQGYKAFENVFSLVTQVVGRSGRSGYAEGRAIIQTLDPQNPVLNMAAKQNYKEFYT
ncbi:MAG: primosomal protein N', partial [Oscillospiraceae bacterium]